MTSTGVVNLSLVSHTNAGKTTLARTMLGRDVGEVRDAPHVTEVSEGHVMLESAAGDALCLWDTPGFGDSARLLQRLRHSGNPLGWLLSQVWDAYADRPLWCSQQAVRNVRDEADVVLYLVNAAERPGDAAWLDAEMQILAWIGKPVVVLLNQTGPPRGRDADAGDEARWRAHFPVDGPVRAVLGLDAFARCWVQEDALLRVLGPLLPPAKREAFDRLAHAWRAQNATRFRAAMAALAAQLARAACDLEELERGAWSEQTARLLRALVGVGAAQAGARERAMVALAERLDAGIRASTAEMIRLHRLEGEAAGEVLRRLEQDYAAREPVSEGRAAALGGFVSGALGGLAADLAAGGLSFGAGALGGGVLGALGAGGLARGYNLVTGRSRPALRWSAGFVEALVRSALLRYLAVAHFGRGRGDYVRSEHPAHWQGAVEAVVEPRKGALRALWERGSRCGDPAALARDYEAVLVACAAELLGRLYPGAAVPEAA